MASIVYDSFLDDVFNGNIAVASDTFYAMGVTSSYTVGQGTHSKRSSITNEVSGTGYTAGGAAVTLTVSKDTSAHTNKITLSTVTWTTSTITNLRAVVVYKHRGGASSADELVLYCDDLANFSTAGGTMTQSFSTPLTYQN